ncbi:MAG TPA: hypothetical protein VNL37_05695 [Candidatus Polarisedimenticolia bacterium]|nr:hypothetical protein [Candidatus Polarisedimenticolia bacterium]
MLDKVPVARILGFLFLATLVLLGWVSYQGYGTSAGRIDAGVHIRLALLAIVVALFTHTMTLFYFVGTGSRIRKVVQDYRLERSLVERTRRFKADLFPWLTYTPLVTMAAFIVGGAAHTRVWPPWIHGVLAVVALAMNLVCAVVAVRSIGENVALIDEIDALLPDDAGEARSGDAAGPTGPPGSR